MQPRPWVLARRRQQPCCLAAGEPAVLAVLFGGDSDVRDRDQPAVLFRPAQRRAQNAKLLGDGGEFCALLQPGVTVALAGDREDRIDLSVAPPGGEMLDGIIDPLRETNFGAAVFGESVENVDYCDFMGITWAEGEPALFVLMVEKPAREDLIRRSAFASTR